MLAANNGHIEAVKMLVNKGADVNAKMTSNGYTALMAASYKGQFEVVKMLLAEGADVNARASDGMTALDAAAKGGHSDVIAILKKTKHKR